LPSRVIARKLGLEELTAVFSREHQGQRKRLDNLVSSFDEKDYATGAEIARELDSSIVQHIVDEENVLLKLFIDVLGREGADDAITVFQQHRMIHKLTDVIARRATASPEGLASTPSELDKLARSHFGAEEERIFPWALDIQREMRKKHPKAHSA